MLSGRTQRLMRMLKRSPSCELPELEAKPIDAIIMNVEPEVDLTRNKEKTDDNLTTSISIQCQNELPVLETNNNIEYEAIFNIDQVPAVELTYSINNADDISTTITCENKLLDLVTINNINVSELPEIELYGSITTDKTDTNLTTTDFEHEVLELSDTNNKDPTAMNIVEADFLELENYFVDNEDQGTINFIVANDGVLVNSNTMVGEEAEIQDDTVIERTTRKRKRKHQSWSRNIAKLNRNSGKEYCNTKKTIVNARGVQPVNCVVKCRLKCHLKFSNNEREAIFKTYWGSKSYERQRDFISRNVIEKPVLRRRKENDARTDNRRNFTKRYYFKELEICKHFFLQTLNIGEKTISYSKNKEILENGIIQSDLRGKREPINKTSKETIKHVHDHIKMFPTMESHYCRKKTTRKYLQSGLNITKMYHLYKDYCSENVLPKVTLPVYRSTFNSSYNLGFHRPKKDACSICERYHNLNDETKTCKEKDIHEIHLLNKVLSREEKQIDKQKATENEEFVSITFDLQSVLTTPCSEVSTLYYVRKFSSYNLTIYNQATKDGQCFLWNENDGNRGSSEIGSIILKYIAALPESVKHITMFSDSCGGQNRNRYLTSLLLWIVNSEKFHIDTIEQKFLETGHTDMECDSMHSTIEHAKKGVPIYSPIEWPTIIRRARRKNPYTVVSLNFNDFYDLKHLKTNTVSSDLTLTIENKKISWMKIKQIKVERGSFSIFVKTSYADTEFKEIPSCEESKRTKCGKLKKKQKSKLVGAKSVELAKLYNGKLPISILKYNDLLKLCSSGVIPEDYQDFYKSLTTLNKKDRLDEEDIEDQTSEDEDED